MAYVCEDCNSGLPPVDEECQECQSDARTWVCICCYDKHYSRPYLLCETCSNTFRILNGVTPNEIQIETIFSK